MSANVYVTISKNLFDGFPQLYVTNEVWDEQDELSEASFYITRKVNDEDQISVKLEDGTGFFISKKQSLNDVYHRYWAITILVPPLDYCKVEYAGRGFADCLWSHSPIRHIWINGEEITCAGK